MKYKTDLVNAKFDDQSVITPPQTYHPKKK